MDRESIFRGFKRACPRCADGRLHWRNWRHWQHVSPDGRRCCDHLVYYECDRCRCRLKVLRGGMVREVDEEEWAQLCEARVPRTAASKGHGLEGEDQP